MMLSYLGMYVVGVPERRLWSSSGALLLSVEPDPFRSRKRSTLRSSGRTWSGSEGGGVTCDASSGCAGGGLGGGWQFKKVPGF